MSALSIQAINSLSPQHQDGVRALVARGVAADGVAALNEDAQLGLGNPGHHVLMFDGDHVIGYGTIADRTAQLLVDPVRRGLGLGTQLAEALLTLSDRTDLQIRGWWAFADLPAARRLAERLGLVRVRELLKLSRPVETVAEQSANPPDSSVTIRPFVPGQDDRSWLELNAQAFATHPEQGRMTQADLQARIAEPWFDPAGFLLAVDADDPGQLLGFHWTKREPSSSIGEVYVLAVAPSAGGKGLGRVLLDAGLAHLAGVGVDTVELYVEGDNEPALALYRRSGFTTAATDVMYARAGEED